MPATVDPAGGLLSFDNQWNATQPPVIANPAAPLAGKWEGTWESDATAYQGLMRVLVVPKSAADQAGVVSRALRCPVQAVSL